jgi:hypothetical protein
LIITISARGANALKNVIVSVRATGPTMQHG